jgi:hypothetical protein
MRFLEYGTETVVIARVGSTVDVCSLTVGAKIDRTLPRRIDTTTGQLLNVRCESGMYHLFPLACPARGAEG